MDGRSKGKNPNPVQLKERELGTLETSSETELSSRRAGGAAGGGLAHPGTRDFTSRLTGGPGRDSPARAGRGGRGSPAVENAAEVCPGVGGRNGAMAGAGVGAQSSRLISF